MLKHPNLLLVEDDITTFKSALKLVEAKSYINKYDNELVRIWTVEVEGGRIVSIWRCSKEDAKVITHSRLPYVIEERNRLFAIYEIIDTPAYLFDLKLLDESYGFESKLTDAQRKKRHLQQMREWRNTHQEYHRKRYLQNKYPLNGGCPNP